MVYRLRELHLLLLELTINLIGVLMVRRLESHSVLHLDLLSRAWNHVAERVRGLVQKLLYILLLQVLLLGGQIVQVLMLLHHSVVLHVVGNQLLLTVALRRVGTGENELLLLGELAHWTSGSFNCIMTLFIQSLLTWYLLQERHLIFWLRDRAGH